MRTCYETSVAGFPVKIEQDERGGRFAVTYGQQVTRGLSYAEAASEFGHCVFHGLACGGLIDNLEEAA